MKAKFLLSFLILKEDYGKAKPHKGFKLSRYRSRKSPRYHPPDPTAEESHVIEYIRRTTAREIVLFLPQHDSRTFNDILRSTKIVHSTLSWHLSRHRDGRLVLVRDGKRQTYSLGNKTLGMLINRIKNYALEIKQLLVTKLSYFLNTSIQFSPHSQAINYM